MVQELTPSLDGSGTICSSNPERVGRDGYLSLEFERRGQRTELIRCRFRLPLQVTKPSYVDDDSSAYVLLLNPAGGLVGGDSLETTIRLRKGTHGCLSTPSATSVYRALDCPASQRTDIVLEEEAILEYFPEHLIPYPQSALRQSLRVQMAAGSCVILSEAFAAGRIARGEKWRFMELISDTEIRLGNSPVFVNKSRIVPDEILPQRLGFAEGFNYIASLVVVADGFNGWRGLINALRSTLDGAPGVQGGASLAGHSGCVARFMAATATQLTSITQSLWACAREIVLNKPALSRRMY